MFLSLFLMTRPHNVLIASASVWFGAWIAGAKLHWTGLILDGIILGLLAAAGNIHNDIVDLPVDRINRPNRPLPAGKIEVWAAWFGVVGLLGISGLLLVFRHPAQCFFSLGIIALLYFYNTRFKGMPLVGNIAVSALCASALWMPAFDPSAWSDLSTPDRLIPLVFFSFVFTFIRELIKDIEDMDGDRALDHRTFPLLFGASVARLFALLLLASAIISTLWPWWNHSYPGSFVVACLFLVYPWLGLSAWHMRPYRENWRKAQTHLKYSMVGGILAAVLSIRVFPLFN